jgi:hypothetical protein
MPAFEMRWRDTLFASWPVDPDLVAPRLPAGLAVDTFDGDAYLSVVPFAIEDIRPEGLPARLGRSTPELNLRTYVAGERRGDGNTPDSPAVEPRDTAETRAEPGSGGTGGSGSGGAAGVYFFSLDADDLLGVVGARLFNHLPYYYAEVDHDRLDDGRMRFVSRRRTPGARAARFDATYGPADAGAEPEPAEPGTLEQFLVERYRYFAEGADGGLRCATIEHDPWRLRPAAWTVGANTLFRANGFAAPAGDPHLVLGADVDVRASAVERFEP